MTDDIVPHLLEQLQSNIEANQETNTKLRQLLLKLRAKEADYIDAHAFAVEAGEIAAQAFKDVLTPDVLPDGRMYYNIGNRLLPSILGERHDLISSYAAKVQTDLNEKAGIHLKTQVPELNMNRIKGLVDRLDREEHFEDVAWILDSPVVGFCMNVVDTTIDKNIKFQYQAGLHPKLTRSLEDGKACKWCRNLAGTYRYPDEVPDMVYHRHNNCRCTTYFYPGDGKRQDVWSKTVEKASKRDIIKKKDIQLPKSVSAKARDIYVKSSYPVRGAYKIKQGSTIRNVHIIAGNKVRRQIDDINRLVREYGTANESLWQKVTGIAELENNHIVEAHWYQHPEVGKVEFKVKRWIT